MSIHSTRLVLVPLLAMCQCVFVSQRTAMILVRTSGAEQVSAVADVQLALCHVGLTPIATVEPEDLEIDRHAPHVL